MTPDILDQSEIEEQWLRLDPIFIMGMQRTGTSVMRHALRAARFMGFPEGHFWFELIEPFARFRDPEYKKHTRHDIFTLGSGRNLALEKQCALAIDQFHRRLLPPDLVRWVDKSPGRYPITVAPMLARIFPRSQFIFTKRNPITTVNSAITLRPDIFQGTCENWTQVMQTWRQVRPMLAGRYIEVAQELIAEEPDLIAARVGEFLGVPQYAEAIADVFKSQRVNTSFPDKDVGDFIYPMDWTSERKRILADVCQGEMAIWGYPLDFQRPSGPNPAHAAAVELEPMEAITYYQWLRQNDVGELARELEHYKELLARINEGRVMRVLNQVNKLLRRLGLQ